MAKKRRKRIPRGASDYSGSPPGYAQPSGFLDVLREKVSGAASDLPAPPRGASPTSTYGGVSTTAPRPAKKVIKKKVAPMTSTTPGGLTESFTAAALVAAGQADPQGDPYALAKKIVDDTIAAQKILIEGERSRQDQANKEVLKMIMGFGGALAEWDKSLAGQQDATLGAAAASQQAFAKGFQDTYNNLAQGNASDFNAWQNKVNPQGGEITPYMPNTFTEGGNQQAAMYQGVSNPWPIVSQADARQAQMDVNAMAATQAREMTKFDDQIASLYQDYGANILEYYAQFKGLANQDREFEAQQRQQEFENDQQRFENNLTLGKISQDQANAEIEAQQFDIKTGTGIASKLTDQFGYLYQYNPKTGKVEQVVKNGQPVEVPGTKGAAARAKAAENEANRTQRAQQYDYTQGTKRADTLTNQTGYQWVYDPQKGVVYLVKDKQGNPIQMPGTPGWKAIQASKNQAITQQRLLDNAGRDEAYRRTGYTQTIWTYDPKTGQIVDSGVPTAKNWQTQWQNAQKKAESKERARHNKTQEQLAAERIAAGKAKAAATAQGAKSFKTGADGRVWGVRADGSTFPVTTPDGKQLRAPKAAPKDVHAKAVQNRQRFVASMRKTIANDMRTTRKGKAEFATFQDALNYYENLYETDLQRYNLGYKFLYNLVLSSWNRWKKANPKGKAKTGSASGLYK